MLAATAFDHENLVLYVSIHQIFSLAVVPFHQARIGLTTVLHLTTDKPPVASDPSSPHSESSAPAKVSQNLLLGQPTTYRISTQEDLYQPDELIRLLPTGGIGPLLILLWQCWNTLLSVLGAIVGYPITAFLEMRGKNKDIEGR
jgi:hypothetical protein